MKKRKLIGLLFLGLLACLPSFNREEAIRTCAQDERIVYANLDGCLTAYGNEKIAENENIVFREYEGEIALNAVYIFDVEIKQPLNGILYVDFVTPDIEEENIRFVKIENDEFFAIDFNFNNGLSTFTIDESGTYAYLNLSNAQIINNENIGLEIAFMSIGILGCVVGVVNFFVGGKKHEK